MRKLLIGLVALFGVFSIGNAAQIISPITNNGDKVGYVVKPNPDKEFYFAKCLTAENDTVGTYKSLHKAVKELKEVCEVNSK
jgi:hypothetical protein